MGSISHHITPLVIDSLGGGHTRIQKFADRSNSKKPGARLVIIDIRTTYTGLETETRAWIFLVL